MENCLYPIVINLESYLSVASWLTLTIFMYQLFISTNYELHFKVTIVCRTKIRSSCLQLATIQKKIERLKVYTSSFHIYYNFNS